MRLRTLAVLALCALPLYQCMAASVAGLPTVWLVNGDTGSAVPFAGQDGAVWVLTAKHLLPIYTVDGHSVVKVIPHPDPLVDAALVCLDVPMPEGMPRLATEAPKFGDPLSVMGWHLGEFLLLTKGYQGYPQTTMSANIMFGASGGAVLNERGEIVGVVEALAVIGNIAQPELRLPISHIAHYEPVPPLRDWILGAILP